MSSLENTVNVKNIIHISRSNPKINNKTNRLHIDLLDEKTMIDCSNIISDSYKGLDIIINATGFLHDNDYKPEKSYKMIDAAYLEKSFKINTFGPFLLAKHFIPLLRKDRKSIFSCISARFNESVLTEAAYEDATRNELAQYIINLSIELKYAKANKVCLINFFPNKSIKTLSKITLSL